MLRLVYVHTAKWFFVLKWSYVMRFKMETEIGKSEMKKIITQFKNQ